MTRSGARMDEAAQDAVISFLSAPGSYAPAPSAVERIGTHGALVFLAGGFAYKIKRAVRLPYLDFSTLERRRQALTRELELNSRAAPELYLGLSAIVRRPDGTLAWRSESEAGESGAGAGALAAGEVLDYVLVMRRFAQEQLLDRMAVEGRLGEELMEPLAARVVEDHARAPAHRECDPVPGFETIVANISATLSGAQSPIAPAEVAVYSAAAREALRTAAPLMRERANHGLVRRCHGDLHLNNIVLLDNGPTLFDALEFDEKLATVDVLYCVAFLLMDLLRRGLNRHACSLFNQYLQGQVGLRHLDGLALMPFFLSMRAGIRAMVAIDRKASLTGAGAEPADQEVRHYFDLAKRFLAPGPARLIAVGGLSGTGKTTLARMLAPDLAPAPGAVHLRSDIERKIMYGWDPHEPLPEVAYSQKISAHVYRRLGDKALRALKAGQSVIVDAVFATSGERSDIAGQAHEAGVPFSGLWLAAPAEVLCERVAAREGDASDADVAVVRQQLTYDLGAIDWEVIDVDAGPETVCARAQTALGLNAGSKNSSAGT